MYMSVFTYVCTCIHVYTHVHTRVYTHVHTRVYTHVHTCGHTVTPEQQHISQYVMYCKQSTSTGCSDTQWPASQPQLSWVARTDVVVYTYSIDVVVYTYSIDVVVYGISCVSQESVSPLHDTQHRHALLVIITQKCMCTVMGNV